MKFTKTLIKGKLIKRYKRFFIDIKVKNKVLTAHCPNTGSMMGLLENNNDIWVSQNDNPKRKLKFTSEIIKVKKNLVGINTHFANKIVHHGLLNNLIDEFKNCINIKSEVFYDKETRFDFLVKKNNEKIFIEVKNVTLSRIDNLVEFPDASKKGFKTYVLFLIQRQEIDYFQIAKDIDKEYYNNYLLAKGSGVGFLAYRCKINFKEIIIEKKIKIIDGR